MAARPSIMPKGTSEGRRTGALGFAQGVGDVLIRLGGRLDGRHGDRARPGAVDARHGASMNRRLKMKVT